jgi:CheY-like chemotaxis protein
MASHALASILMVDDNPGDVRLTTEALRETGVRAEITAVHDGVEAMAYLRRQPPWAGQATPALVLLDLNLPRMDGRAVLRAIKGDTALRRIPVVVLSTSQAPMDVSDAYDLGANCYIVKPIDLDEFVGVLRDIERFWLGRASLPQG